MNTKVGWASRRRSIWVAFDSGHHTATTHYKTVVYDYLMMRKCGSAEKKKATSVINTAHLKYFTSGKKNTFEFMEHGIEIRQDSFWKFQLFLIEFGIACATGAWVPLKRSRW